MPSVKRFVARVNAMLQEQSQAKFVLKVFRGGARRPASVAHCTYDKHAGKTPKERVGLYLFERETSCREPRRAKPRSGRLQCVASIVVDLRTDNVYARVHQDRQKHGLYALLSALTVQFLAECLPTHKYVADCVVFSSAAVLKSFVWHGAEAEREKFTAAVTKDRVQAERDFRRVVVTVDPLDKANTQVAGLIVEHVLKTIKFGELCTDTPRLTTSVQDKKKKPKNEARTFRQGKCYYLATGIPPLRNPDGFAYVASVVNQSEVNYVLYARGKKIAHSFVLSPEDWDPREPRARLQQKFCPFSFPTLAPEDVIGSATAAAHLSRASLAAFNSLQH